jgi:NADH-quinone oxidoreductase subunit G
MSQDKIKIEVDGQELEATPGQMLIEVTDAADIYIPRFCYHRKLSVAANCRMCLVQVENAPKPLPACATPVNPGMKVHTRNEYAIEAQKATMEFLLINHPLDCPICDQGGECELQDIAMGYGRDISRFSEGKRVVKDKDLGPLVSTDMTRCILCTRCVRFGQEVAGIQELGAMGRGDTMEIGTFIEQNVDHELSGNIIDLCPVGALNNKPYRMSARAWEMEQRATIAPHDCLGSNMYAHVLRGKLKRVVPDDNDAINETWLSDRDRFSYEGIYSDDRLAQPMVRVDGKLQLASWEDALEKAAQGLHKVVQSSGGESLGAWVSPSATVEEAYLTGKIVRYLGSNNIDHRLRRRDFRGQEAEASIPGLGMSVADVETLDNILVVGSNLRKEVPLLAHRIRKAAIDGAGVSFINAETYDYLFPVAQYIENDNADFHAELMNVLNESDAASKAVLESLATGDTAIFLGHMALRHPAYAEILQTALRLADKTGARLGIISEGANAAGASYAGALPYQGPAGVELADPGMDLGQMLASPVKALLLTGVEPEYDCADDVAALNALNDAAFVVALTPWLTASAREHADVVLPIGTFAETAGTFVNAACDWQSFTGVCKPVGESRPGWKVLRVIGNLLDIENFDYETSAEVRDELLGLSASLKNFALTDLDAAAAVTVRPADLDVPVYAVDALTRRATALQQTVDADIDWRKSA